MALAVSSAERDRRNASQSGPGSGGSAGGSSPRPRPGPVPELHRKAMVTMTPSARPTTTAPTPWMNQYMWSLTHTPFEARVGGVWGIDNRSKVLVHLVRSSGSPPVAHDALEQRRAMHRREGGMRWPAAR